MPCLGAFGGPVDPNVALGGFGRKLTVDNPTSKAYNDIILPPSLSVEPSGSPDYQTAEALIITFVVKNHLDESANKMAETWEKAFLQYLDNYNSSKINITYSAEVSWWTPEHVIFLRVFSRSIHVLQVYVHSLVSTLGWLANKGLLGP